MPIVEIAAAATAITAIGGIIIALVKLGRMAGVMEATLSNQNTVISELKTDFKTVAQVVTQQAVTTTRMDSMSQMLVGLSSRVEELAHGEGFVFPLGAHFPPKTKIGG